jgi:hypothetical protein
MLSNLTIRYHQLASVVVHCVPHVLRDPLCIIELVVAALYLAAILTLLYRHRWLWLVYGSLAAAHIAAAVALATAHP